jgi:hypothetical protein
VDAGGKFSMPKLITNLAPPAVGIVGSMVASKFKVNRYISGIPWFKF